MKPSYKLMQMIENVLLPEFREILIPILVFGGFRDRFIWQLNGDSYMSIMERG